MSLAPFFGRHLSRSVPSIFDDFAPLLRAATNSTWADGSSLRPALDVREDEKGYHVQAELPGIKKEDVQLKFAENGRLLTLSGSYVLRHDGLSDAHSYQSEHKEEPTDNQTHWLSEISRGSFARSIKFPLQIDENGVKAAMNDGLLKISCPKAAPEQTAAKSITIE